MHKVLMESIPPILEVGPVQEQSKWARQADWKRAGCLHIVHPGLHLKLRSILEMLLRTELQSGEKSAAI